MIQTEVHQCLFCNAVYNGDNLPNGGKGHWYGQRVTLNGHSVTFYLCPKHLAMKVQAFNWAKQGFVEDDINDLQGMKAVNKWLEHYPILRKKALELGII